MRGRPPKPIRVERARRHLWGATFAVIAALVGSVAYLSNHDALDIPGLSPSRLQMALAGIAVAFVVYAVDRERHLRRLNETLTEERVASARLAAHVESLRELQRERDANAALIEGAADGVAVVGGDLRVLRLNKAMEQLCGVTAEEAEGAYAPAVLRFAAADGHPLSGDEHPLHAAAGGAGSGEPIDVQLHVAGGAVRWVSATFSRIGDPDGASSYVLAVLRDVTRAKEVEAMQRDFVSIVSHELRAPLTAIKGFAKTLLQRGDTLPPESKESFLSTINEQADRLARLVDDLLQVSRIDARRLHVEPSPHDLAPLVGKLSAQFESRWAHRLDVAIPGSLPPVSADGGKLEEVLINLIDNAMKYSPAEAPVRVTARDADGEVEIAVEDRGEGIAAEDAAKLFQKFQRLSTPATRDVGGSGLGLYIVKGLVDAMGGRVWVESAPGAGSTFAFALPAASGARGLERVGA